MRESLKNLPNLITLGNLLCGSIGIERLIQNDMITVFILIIVAAILDFFDGFTARLLNVGGEMGKQLDSLADLVTFGVLPGLIVYHYSMQLGFCNPDGFCTSRYAWLAIPAASAWRLARFNIENTGSTEFKGVPTPITGITFAALILVFEKTEWFHPAWLTEVYSNFYFLTMSPIIAAFFMVSDYRMISLKFKKADPLNPWKIGYLILCVLLFAVFMQESGPLIYVFYVLTSLLANFVTREK